MPYDIAFPHLRIIFPEVSRVAVNIFGIDIYFYGIFIAAAIFAGYLYGVGQARKSGQNTDIYSNYLFVGVIAAIVCARLYYVIFTWDSFKNDPIRILFIKDGGLAIYGGIIGAVGSAYLYNRKIKYSFIKFMDTAVCSLFVGQAVGRWGNFFNREAFGEYTNGPFAMRIRLDEVSSLRDVTEKMRANIITLGDVQYIQVHPTFLYECLWNIAAFILINSVYKKHKKFEGEITCMYFFAYGLGRLWIEGLRTDQLLVPGTAVPVSQALSLLIVIASAALIVVFRRKKSREPQELEEPKED